MASVLPRYSRRGVMAHDFGTSEDISYSLALTNNSLSLVGSNGSSSTVQLPQPDLSKYMKRDAVVELISQRLGSSSVLG